MIQPPKYPLRFLRWFCREDYIEEIEGDLIELFEKRVEGSPAKARRRFVWDVLKSFRLRNIKATKSQNSNYTAMFQHYFIISWRNLLRNKGYSLINIGGLSVGMAVAMLIGLWIYDELSFNKYHQHYETIGQVMVHNGERTTKTNPIPLAAELRTSFGEDLASVVMTTQPQNYIIAADDKKFMQSGSYMEAGAPELFTLEMLAGSRTALENQNSILLSQSLAAKLFGETDPMNKLVKIDNELDVTVAGVYEDLPGNSALYGLTFIAPWRLMVASYDYIKNHEDNWQGNFLHVYVRLAQSADFDAVSEKIRNIKQKHLTEEQLSGNPELFVLPMSRWHLYSQFENRKAVTSDRLQFVWFYGIIGVFVLSLACINFMNLSTARSERRAKEVGIRKMFGTARVELVRQFLTESVFTALLSALLAVLLVQLVLPWFNSVADKHISILWAEPLFWLAVLAFTLFTGVLAGSYPSVYLSSFRPAQVLKGSYKSGRFAAIPRKILVVVQFSVSFSLMIGTIIVYQQIQHAKSRPLGYAADGLVMFPKTASGFQGKSELISNELKNTGVIREVAEAASKVTSEWGSNGGFSWEGKDPGFQAIFSTMGVSHEYGKAVGLQLIAGRDFSREFASDSAAFVINEAAAKYMGLEDPVGKTVSWETDFFDGGNFRIIGVVKDMVMSSPFEPVKPTIFFLQGYKGWIVARLKPGVSMTEALSKVEQVFGTIVPDAPFEYRFADEDYTLKFAEEERIGKLSSVFAGLTIFISCLGLFGLSAFTAERRTKEIGIRKVLGASVAGLWKMLSKDFLVLVVISCFIAMPVAIYIMNSWLDNYAYRTDIQWYVIAFAAGGTVLITLLTVSYQAIKAARANPVKSLRTE